MTWTGEDGWPAQFPDALKRVLSDLPGAENTPEEQLTAWAVLLVAVADGGLDEELPAARVASAEASNRELSTFHDLSKKLAAHIETMHAPAVSALFEQGTSVSELARSLQQAAEHARNAYGYTSAPEKAAGRKPDVAAPSLTDVAAEVFERITGRPATYTSDIETSHVRGDWPEFLAGVFAALGIKASAASQAKAFGAKNRAKSD